MASVGFRPLSRPAYQYRVNGFIPLPWIPRARVHEAIAGQLDMRTPRTLGKAVTTRPTTNSGPKLKHEEQTVGRANATIGDLSLCAGVPQHDDNSKWQEWRRPLRNSTAL